MRGQTFLRQAFPPRSQAQYQIDDIKDSLCAYVNEVSSEPPISSKTKATFSSSETFSSHTLSLVIKAEC